MEDTPARVEGLEGADAASAEAAGNSDEAAGNVEADGEPVAAAEASDVPVPYTLAGIGEKTVRKLVDAGLDSQDAVAAATVERLSAIPGIGEKTADKILAAARGIAPADTETDTESSADL